MGKQAKAQLDTPHRDLDWLISTPDLHPLSGSSLDTTNKKKSGGRETSEPLQEISDPPYNYAGFSVVHRRCGLRKELLQLCTSQLQ